MIARLCDAYADVYFKKCLCYLFLSAKRAYCSANWYGPETITLTWTENNGNCSYYVYDFTNRGNSNSTALSYSSAKVVVYKGNTLLNTYNVPIGFSGTTWNVFSINNGDLTTINTIS